MRHRTRLLTSLLTFIIILAVLPLSGCRSLLNLAGGVRPSVDAVVMCHDVDSSFAPLNPATTFATNTPEIFCSVKVSNAPAQSRARVEWIYREGELEGVKDYLIDTSTVTTEGTRYIAFSLSIPDDGWPEGLYELVLYMDDKKMESVLFTVSGSSPTPTPTPTPTPQPPEPTTPPGPTTPTISEVTMARDVTMNDTPVNPTSSFDAGTLTVYTTMLVSDAPEHGVRIRAEWYEMGPSDPVLREWHEIDVRDGYAHFYYTKSNGWPAGEYAIRLYVDGDLQATIPYSVIASGPQVSEATMARDVDDEGRPVNPTTVFPSNATHIYCSVYIESSLSSTHARGEWYYLRGPDLPYTDHLYATAETTVEEGADYWWFNIHDPTGGFFPRGEYAFILFLDDQEEVYLEFAVQ